MPTTPVKRARKRRLGGELVMAHGAPLRAPFLGSPRPPFLSISRVTHWALRFLNAPGRPAKHEGPGVAGALDLLHTSCVSRFLRVRDDPEAPARARDGDRGVAP